MRVLLIDDERPARDRLRRLLEAFAEVRIVGEAGDGVTALELVDRLRPDAVFLDIEMPELDGLAVAAALENRDTAIVFVTAYDEFALRAFEVNAVDYLVKPIPEARLRATLDRLRARRVAGAGSPAVSRLLAALEGERPFAVRSGNRYVVCEPRRIGAVVARDHYAAILYEGRELLSEESLDRVEARLAGGRFLRVHRSAIVNLDQVRELQREGDRKYVAVLAEPAGLRVPISRERLEEILQRLGMG